MNLWTTTCFSSVRLNNTTCRNVFKWLSILLPFIELHYFGIRYIDTHTQKKPPLLINM